MESNTPSQELAASTPKYAFYGRTASKSAPPPGIEAQLQNCREHAESKGGTILEDHLYIDEGKAGADLSDRPGLQKLLAAAMSDAKPLNLVLIDKTSRLACRTADILEIIEFLHAHGVTCNFVGQRLESQAPNFKMFVSVIGVLDELPSRSHGDKIAAGNKCRFLAGQHIGSIPYGYRAEKVYSLAEDNRSTQVKAIGTKLVVLPHEAAVVTRIFHEYSVGKSTLTISRDLNGEGAGTPGPASVGKLWTAGAIQRILHNERYVGRDFFNKSRTLRNAFTGKTVKVKREASEVLWRDAPELQIVSQELWDAAHAQLKRHAEKKAGRG